MATRQPKIPGGNTRLRLSAITKIDREDFGLRWNAALEAGSMLLGDDVTITPGRPVLEGLNRLVPGIHRMCVAERGKLCHYDP